MEHGILFSKSKEPRMQGSDYTKSYVFSDANRSSFWDRDDSSRRFVTPAEAKYYDEIMKKIINPQF